MNGILLVNKESGMTSRDVVNKVCKLLGTKQVGHTGTLDPLASGVLVLCVGNATKLVEILTNHDKEYIVEMLLGVSTDTYDITGNILRQEDVTIDKTKLEQVLKSMVGNYMQEVPIYSAVKINGKKLYEYARNNESVVLPKREVSIKSIELLSIDSNKIKFKTNVSKGTYIRSLVCDIAKKLDTIGIMTNLIRTRQGMYDLKDCYTLKDVEVGKYNLLDINTCLNDYPKINVSDSLLRAIKNGAIITNRWNIKEVVFIDENNSLIALYKPYEKDINMLKPWKMF